MNRNFIGYGRYPPSHIWPNDARIAINFVINYEEGAESNVLDGDSESESLKRCRLSIGNTSRHREPHF